MGCPSELRFQVGQLSQRTVHQTFRLDDVQARGGSGFQLQTGQVERFTPRRKVLARQRNPLLIIADVDIGRYQL